MQGEELRQLIGEGESDTVEIKLAPPRVSELAERLCGLANARGGYLIIGVRDSTWEIVGVKNLSAATDIIIQAGRMCKPTLRVVTEKVIVESKNLLVARVEHEEGVIHQAGGTFWIRRGTQTVPMELKEIQAFLYAEGTLNWETQPVKEATLESLDLERVKEYLERRPGSNRQKGRLDNIPELLVNLGCAAREGNIIRPTNAGMLMFGYAPQDFIPQAEVVCTVFPEGDALGAKRYVARKTIIGTLPEQLAAIEEFFNQYMTVGARTEGFQRTDLPEYPTDALREAAVNAVIHRDYSIVGGRVRIFYYTGNRLEIHNPGKLMPDISLEELARGQAQSSLRNPIMGRILENMPGNYMERMGSGISYMITQLRRAGNPEPEFRERGEFLVILRSSPEPVPNLVPKPTPVTKTALPTLIPVLGRAEERQQLALKYVDEHGYITNLIYRQLTGVSEITAKRDLAALLEQGSVRAEGQNKGRRYLR